MIWLFSLPDPYLVKAKYQFNNLIKINIDTFTLNTKEKSVSYNAVSQKQERLYEDKTIKCSYETTDGRFNGNYISYYKNGQKKSEGKFENNYRTGKWTVWDSKGKVIMQRVYENPFVIKQLIPEVPNDKPITLLNIPQYNLEYNKDGFINNFDFDERMVVWNKRIWRNLVPKDNPVLFEKNIGLIKRDSVNSNDPTDIITILILENYNIGN